MSTFGDIDGSAQNYPDSEGRLAIQDIPDKISRVFFGDPQAQYGQGTSQLLQFKNYE